MSRKYFGTDGVRGRVGQTPMTPEFALKLGWAAGCVLGGSAGARVLIGKDTRRSGYLFESALEAGFAAAGVESDLLGPLPTPAVAYLTRALRAQAGVVISASHNPHYDNGVKFFGADGSKLGDELELQIESMLEQPMVCVAPELLGRAKRIDDCGGRYIEFCKGTFGERSLNGLRIVIDCANGAAYKVGPAVLEELGAEVKAIGVAPNGLNINLDCGSTHLDALKRAVLEFGADVGIALDGDADRCLMIDANGELIDGDQILFVLAQIRHQQGLLDAPVVGTVMSNLGLEQAIRALGVEFIRAQVGDRHVMEQLKLVGGTLGGETSGHTICLDKTTTGDGMVAALQVLAAMTRAKLPLAQLVGGMRKFPQVLINVPIKGLARDVLQHADVGTAEAEVRRQLGSRGRTLLRASGTEPLIRVMVEAQEPDETLQAAEFLAAQVRAACR
ncbi:phosphoglucosamine mutase [Sinimarinibacterium sp. CAU 1509]|uniref:phosphoglucosamine mutase n=1 Tax=Sinimarinibacterium sp. CAU 1509 TaxID=2562283 RepID=UPI0010ACFD23|nr:phosphoglucosamine mutase [Sinimarinibacterium sp. CAU 1509]TJY62170.1 phosphoglucosamine mutase [Sinimarinibacterium sp. CAU 1509]